MYYRSFRKYGKVLETNYLVTLKKCAKLENKEMEYLYLRYTIAVF
jgi:hypothetical protein